MASCDFCGTTILFGGKRDGEFRFCNDKCVERGYVLTLSNKIPEHILEARVEEVHQGACPKCHGPGPVDVQTSHTVWSAVLLTSWNSHPEVCCGSCGTKKMLGGIVFSLLFGWWGFPWGLFATPIQVGRNITGLFSRPKAEFASEGLRKMLKIDLAARAIEEKAALDAEAAGAEAIG